MAKRAQGDGKWDELSSLLAALRKTARVSQTDAGRVAGLGQRTVSRIEAGLYLPTPDELDALLRQYEPDRDTAQRLRDKLVARLAEPPSRRIVARAGGVATIQRRTRLLEENAKKIEAFQPSIVIGLAQSEAYVRAVFDRPEVSDAAAAITERLERQSKVFASSKEVTLVHSEGALLNALFSPRVMAEQAEYLAELANGSAGYHVHVGIVPFWQPLPHPAMSGFRLYDRTTLTVSSETGELFPPNETVIQEYAELFDQITDIAEFGETAARHFERIAASYREWCSD